MDPKVAYWTGAWLNMLAIVGLAALGVRNARRGNYAQHRRCMLGAASLVGLFLASYVVKLIVLGREQLELWPRVDVYVLRFHELCVATLVLGGGYALGLALRRGMPVAAGDLRERTHLWHRRAGRAAVTGMALGLLSASWVLWGMYARLP